MRKILFILILSSSILASDFQPPVLDPIGVMPSAALTALAQESGAFYNPALAAFNFPSLQYSQGNFAMDCSGLFSVLGEKSPPSYDELKRAEEGSSYTSFSRTVYVSGRGGAFGYIYHRELAAFGTEGEKFSPENPEDFLVNYKIRQRKEVFFSKAYFLRKNRIFMGITTKYVFYKNWSFSLPISDGRNFASPGELLSLEEGEEEAGKRMALDVGFAGFLTGKLMFAVSMLDIPISRGEKLTPEYILVAGSYKISSALYLSAGADASSYKNRYFLSLLFDARVINLGVGLRQWEGEKFYSLYGALRYRRLSLRAGMNLRDGEKAGFMISLAITNAF